MEMHLGLSYSPTQQFKTLNIYFVTAYIYPNNLPVYIYLVFELPLSIQGPPEEYLEWNSSSLELLTKVFLVSITITPVPSMVPNP